MLVRLVILPGIGAARMATDLRFRGWLQLAQGTALADGEPLRIHFSHAEGDARALYLFEPRSLFRLLLVEGRGAARHAEALHEGVPFASEGDAERWLSSDRDEEILRGLRAAEQLRAFPLLGRVIDHRRSADAEVALAARRTRDVLLPRLTEEAFRALAARHAPGAAAPSPLSGDALLDRQALRWMMRLHDPALRAAVERGLADRDDEVRLTALVAAARLGDPALIPLVRSVELPGAARSLDARHAAFLELLRQAAIEHLAGKPEPPPPDALADPIAKLRAAAWGSLRRAVARRVAQPEDALSLFVHALVTPPRLGGIDPPLSAPGIDVHVDGHRLARTGFELSWVGAIPHWLGPGEETLDTSEALAAIRSTSPAAGYYMFRRPLSRAEVERLRQLDPDGPGSQPPPSEETSDGAAPYYADRTEAARLVAALSRIEGTTTTLPSADEWEMAARGPDGRRYPWGNAAPAEPGHLASPWGLEGAVALGQWTGSTTATGEAVVVGLDSGLRCSTRRAVPASPEARFAVRPVVYVGDPPTARPPGGRA